MDTMTTKCYVKMPSQLTGLKSCFVTLKKVDASAYTVEKKKASEMSREQKLLLLPKKKTGSLKQKNSRTPASQKKDKKFQLKITGFMKKKNPEEDSSNDPTRESSPDSGFGDRGETPSACSDREERDGEEDTAAKEFLDSIEDEDVNSSEEENSSDEEDWRMVDEKKAWDKPKKAKRKPAAKGSKRSACGSNPFAIPGALTGELSAYEKAREENIKEREEMLKALMADWADFKDKNMSKKTPKAKSYRSRDTQDGELRRSTRASIGTKPEHYSELADSTPTKRKRYELAEEYSDYEDDEDEDGEGGEKRRRVHPDRWTFDPNTAILMPEDVTDSMLRRVIMKGDGKAKVWDQARGTTCHQCRQKTLDQKTICRSGHCAGGRGLFCGVCLYNRYGLDAREELKNPRWQCPPCLGICNCSICRNRLGKGATGILIHLAQEKGFESVHHYLEYLKTGKKEKKEKVEDSENEEEREEEK